MKRDNGWFRVASCNNLPRIDVCAPKNFYASVTVTVTEDGINHFSIANNICADSPFAVNEKV